MENCAFIDIFTTHNDLYGKHNCPIQVRFEIFTNDDIFKDDFLENQNRIKEFNIIPDEEMLPYGEINSGYSNEDLKTEKFNGIDLKASMESVYRILEGLISKNVYMIGYNISSFDLKILVDNIERITGKKIDITKAKIIDLYEIARNRIGVEETGSYSMDVVFHHYYKNLSLLSDIKMEKGPKTDIKLSKMILLKMMNKGELFSDFVKRTSDPIEAKVFGFGKHKGTPIEIVFKEDPQYISWVLKNKDFAKNNPGVISTLNKILSTPGVNSMPS